MYPNEKTPEPGLATPPVPGPRTGDASWLSEPLPERQLPKVGRKTAAIGAVARKQMRHVPPEMLQAFALQLKGYIPELGTEADLARAFELFLADHAQHDRSQETGERQSWLRRAEVCRRCGISLRTLDYWLERGLLAKQKVGRIVMVDMRELQRLMQTHTVRNQDGVAA